jgi:hypothetical protein
MGLASLVYDEEALAAGINCAELKHVIERSIIKRSPAGFKHLFAPLSDLRQTEFVFLARLFYLWGSICKSARQTSFGREVDMPFMNTKSIDFKAIVW